MDDSKAYLKERLATTEQLVEVRKRLRAGKLTTDDIKQLENVVLRVEEASKALRAAIVE
jgi:hypothetical protein